MRIWTPLLLAVASLAPAHANLVGTFATDGGGATVTTTLSSLTFGLPPNLVVANPGTFTFGALQHLTIGETGTIANIGTVLPINNFVSFAIGGLDFILQNIGPGDLVDPHDCSTATSNGKSCSLLTPSGVSPVILTFSNGHTSAALSLSGTVTDAVGDLLADWTGTISSTITANLNSTTVPPGLNVAPTPVNIAAYFAANPLGAIVSSHSETFDVEPEVPENGSALLILGGLLVFAHKQFRKFSV